MQTLILVGIALLLAVLSIDCIVRLIIVWNMRKRKRAVKPLGVIDPDANVDEHANNEGVEIR